MMLRWVRTLFFENPLPFLVNLRARSGQHYATLAYISHKIIPWAAMGCINCSTSSQSAWAFFIRKISCARKHIVWSKIHRRNVAGEKKCRHMFRQYIDDKLQLWPMTGINVHDIYDQSTRQPMSSRRLLNAIHTLMLFRNHRPAHSTTNSGRSRRERKKKR